MFIANKGVVNELAPIKGVPPLATLYHLAPQFVDVVNTVDLPEQIIKLEGLVVLGGAIGMQPSNFTRKPSNDPPP